MRATVFFLILGSTLMGASTPAFAVLGWMRGSAISTFTDADWEILTSEVDRVLDEEPDRKIVDWHNPDSGNGGSIRPLESFVFNDQRCRKTALRNRTAKGVAGQGVYNLCKQADGNWMFVTESEIERATPQ
jgi:surface antigen